MEASRGLSGLLHVMFCCCFCLQIIETDNSMCVSIRISENLVLPDILKNHPGCRRAGEHVLQSGGKCEAEEE